MERRSNLIEENDKQLYDENISSNLVSSMEALKVLFQLLTAPGLEEWGRNFMDQFQDEMKRDLEEDEEKAEVLLEVMESLGKIYEDDEEWIEPTKVTSTNRRRHRDKNSPRRTKVTSSSAGGRLGSYSGTSSSSSSTKGDIYFITAPGEIF